MLRSGVVFRLVQCADGRYRPCRIVLSSSCLPLQQIPGHQQVAEFLDQRAAAHAHDADEEHTDDDVGIVLDRVRRPSVVADMRVDFQSPRIGALRGQSLR